MAVHKSYEGVIRVLNGKTLIHAFLFRCYVSRLRKSPTSNTFLIATLSADPKSLVNHPNPRHSPYSLSTNVESPFRLEPITLTKPEPKMSLPQMKSQAALRST